MRASLSILLAALLLSGVVQAQMANAKKQENIQAMTLEKYDKPNPNAPKELSHFAFLIGNWRCDVKVREQNGTWTKLQATWSGRYILDGYVIADEYRMFDANGNLIMLGMNYRSYNAQSKNWQIKWLEALSATWLDLGPEELGGVRIEENSISYQALFRPNEIHRIKYSNISEDHFTWSVDISKDGGKTWDESIMVIEAYRLKDE